MPEKPVSTTQYAEIVIDACTKTADEAVDTGSVDDLSGSIRLSVIAMVPHVESLHSCNRCACFLC